MASTCSITRMLLNILAAIIILLKVLFLGNLVEAQEAPGSRHTSVFNNQTCVSFIYTGILSGPNNQIIPQGEIAHFNCHAEGTSVLWYINDSLADPQSEKFREFNFTYVMIVPHSYNRLGEENNTIAVVAHPSINNTRIKCKAQGQAHGPQDDVEVEAILIVIGM